MFSRSIFFCSNLDISYQLVKFLTTMINFFELASKVYHCHSIIPLVWIYGELTIFSLKFLIYLKIFLYNVANDILSLPNRTYLKFRENFAEVV